MLLLSLFSILPREFALFKPGMFDPVPSQCMEWDEPALMVLVFDTPDMVWVWWFLYPRLGLKFALLPLYVCLYVTTITIIIITITITILTILQY